MASDGLPPEDWRRENDETEIENEAEDSAYVTADFSHDLHQMITDDDLDQARTLTGSEDVSVVTQERFNMLHTFGAHGTEKMRQLLTEIFPGKDKLPCLLKAKCIRDGKDSLIVRITVGVNGRREVFCVDVKRHNLRAFDRDQQSLDDINGLYGSTVFEGVDLDTHTMLIDQQQKILKNQQKDLTPLLVAVWAENHVAVTWFLSLGADVRETDCHGNTALMLAALTGNEEILLRILACLELADLDVKNEDDETALDLAVKNGHENIELLIICQKWDRGFQPLKDEMLKLDEQSDAERKAACSSRIRIVKEVQRLVGLTVGSLIQREVPQTGSREVRHHDNQITTTVATVLSNAEVLDQNWLLF